MLRCYVLRCCLAAYCRAACCIPARAVLRSIGAAGWTVLRLGSCACGAALRRDCGCSVLRFGCRPPWELRVDAAAQIRAAGRSPAQLRGDCRVLRCLLFRCCGVRVLRVDRCAPPPGCCEGCCCVCCASSAALLLSVAARGAAACCTPNHCTTRATFPAAARRTRFRRFVRAAPVPRGPSPEVHAAPGAGFAHPPAQGVRHPPTASRRLRRTGGRAVPGQARSRAPQGLRAPPRPVGRRGPGRAN